jgi:DNA-binding transcriptional ArsR family regulator
MAAAVAEDDALWAAVADPTRRRVLDALLEHGEATSTTLAEGLPVTRQAVAKHLTVLNRVGLVAGQRRGREVRYGPSGWTMPPKRWLVWRRSGTGAWHGSSGSPSP